MITIAQNTIHSELIQTLLAHNLFNQPFVRMSNHTQIFMVTIYSLLHYMKKDRIGVEAYAQYDTETKETVVLKDRLEKIAEMR